MISAMPELRLRPGRTFALLGALWCVLLIGWAGTQYYARHIAPARIARLEHSGEKIDDTTRAAILNPRGIVKLFDLDGEVNLPEMYQTLGLVFCAVLLFAIGSYKKTTRDALARYWRVLAWLFLFLSIDSGCSIHNNFHVYTAHTHAQQQKQGLFYFSWTLAYGLLMLPLGLWYIRFLLKLPRRTAIHIFVAGVIYVAGAMGMEMVFGNYLAHGGSKHSKAYLIFTTIEESMETLGTLLFIRVLLQHMVDQGIAFRIMPAADVSRAVTGSSAATDLRGAVPGPLGGAPALARDNRGVRSL
jgi:hypothetical protein